MPAAAWSITIKPGATAGAPAIFDPNPLNARVGDVVSWNNTTDKRHQIWQLDASNKPVPMPIGASGRWEPIASGEQSPAWSIPAGAQSFQYGCLLDYTGSPPTLTETGKITIIT